MRRRKVDREALVDRIAVRGQERQVGRVARASVLPQTAWISGARSRPEARTMPTAPRPLAVAIATIGS